MPTEAKIRSCANLLAREAERGSLTDTDREELAAAVRQLESDWPALALIVEARIHAGPDAMIVIHDNEDVLLCDSDGTRVLRSWRVDPATVDALRPVAAMHQGRGTVDRSA